MFYKFASINMFCWQNERKMGWCGLPGEMIVPASALDVLLHFGRRIGLHKKTTYTGQITEKRLCVTLNAS